MFPNEFEILCGAQYFVAIASMLRMFRNVIELDIDYDDSWLAFHFSFQCLES